LLVAENGLDGVVLLRLDGYGVEGRGIGRADDGGTWEVARELREEDGRLRGSGLVRATAQNEMDGPLGAREHGTFGIGGGE
jgi:hypothetical protein